MGSPSTSQLASRSAAIAVGTASSPARPRAALSIASSEWPKAVPMLRCMLESVRSRCIRDCTRVEASTSSRALETSRLASAFSKRIGLTLWGIVDEPTVPHKVNPIRFENAEANLEVSNALLDVLASTLVQSRMQRDLTDSSMQRNIGTAFGHSLLAIDNAARGLAGLDAVPTAMAADLEANWEVLGEPIQSVMRALGAQGVEGMENP